MLPSHNSSVPENKISSSTEHTDLAITPSPMSQEQLREFTTALEGGWGLPGLLSARTGPGNSTSSETAAPADFGINDVHSQCVEEIYFWLSETLDDYFHLAPRVHAEQALREFCDPPCSREELLAFFKAFADAYQRLLLLRLEIVGTYSDDTKSTSDELKDVLSLSATQVYPDRVKHQLARLEAYAKKSPEHAELFKLAELAGCSAKELALYLQLPEDLIQRRIEYRRYDIFTSTSEI